VFGPRRRIRECQCYFLDLLVTCSQTSGMLTQVFLIVDEKSPLPPGYGIDEVKPTTLWSTIVSPFQLLVRYYGPRSSLAADTMPEQQSGAR